MQHIDHPDSYKDGCRFLLLNSRVKDNAVPRKSLTRISHNRCEFDAALEELRYLASDKQRVYGSLCRRDINKASRIFKQRQLDADYDLNTNEFYMNIEARWNSCVQSKKSQMNKLWLIDCDTTDERQLVTEELHKHYTRAYEPYWYKTKNGHHCIIEPFNRMMMSEDGRRLIKENSLLLWSF
jgi:hypothetical protein